MACYLGDLPANDLDRAKAVFEAFAESPLPDDRRRVGVSFVARLTQADHDAGLALWDRLIRDVDEDVRFTAYDLLTEIISDLSSAELRRRNITGSLSMRQKLELADKHELQELTGLSRPDAYRLLESYALAERGMRQHDLGRVALEKLITTIPARTDRTQRGEPEAR